MPNAKSTTEGASLGGVVYPDFVPFNLLNMDKKLWIALCQQPLPEAVPGLLFSEGASASNLGD